MQIELKKLQPNPFRDFAVDPIDDAAVERLKASIKEDDFWGIPPVRKKDGEYQLSAGHHRVRAAIAAGVKTAELTVKDISDERMIQIYARENATQRGGDTGTCQAGAVASAVKWVAKSVLKGDQRKSSDHAVLGNLTSDKGIGYELILRFLDGVPGITVNAIKQQLANLKSSGHYARLITEVQAELEAEHAEELKALAKAEAEQKRLEAEAEKARQREVETERTRKEAVAKAKKDHDDLAARRAVEKAKQQQKEAEAIAIRLTEEAKTKREVLDDSPVKKMHVAAQKAVDVATSKPKVFDFEGAASLFKVAHHLDVFRDAVIAAKVPFGEQKAHARGLFALAKEMSSQLGRPVTVDGTFLQKYAGRDLEQVQEGLRDALQRKQTETSTSQAKQIRVAQDDVIAALKKAQDAGKHFLSLLDDDTTRGSDQLKMAAKTCIGVCNRIVAKCE